MLNEHDTQSVSVADEMKSAYLDYAMSVIVSRALPDARDGLKPVHRRILYSMHVSGYDHSRPYRKSARIVGEVIGKYHPHGESAVYDSLVRMAQPFSLRGTLIDGQGNFGSVDGDPPAAMRYTEVRLKPLAAHLIKDLTNDTVDFQSNYDNSEKEPLVLPARFPNLLHNGASGIAVGMATNIPPHNLGELIDACEALTANPDLSDEDLLSIIPGPDFPTSGIILGRSGIRSAYLTGRGSIVMRARVATEEIRADRYAIVVSEIPFQVNKSNMIERIADAVRDGRIDGISDIRDESDRDGMRVVIELKRDANPDVTLNQLYRYSAMQSTFGANLVALNGGRPEVMTLRSMLQAFLVSHEVIVTRRTRHFLNRARDRAHILIGLAVAVANIDEVIHLIRASSEPAQARNALLGRSWPASTVIALITLVNDPNVLVEDDDTFRFSDRQVRAILDLRLQRLTALGANEIAGELDGLAKQIQTYLDRLGSREKIVNVCREERQEIRDQFATPRRTEIIESGPEFDDEDLIRREDMVVTTSRSGYIKRVPLSTYRAQRRGGRGRSGMSTRAEDVVTRLFIASTHSPLLFCSSVGRAYLIKVWRLPEAQPQARGKALINLLPLQTDELITSILPLPEERNSDSTLQLMFATRSGKIRRNELSDFDHINRSGKIAMRLESDDAIVDVVLCDPETDDVLLTTQFGRCIRFPVLAVRLFKGRDSLGVRGITLSGEDRVISMSILRHCPITREERDEYFQYTRNIEPSETARSTEDTEGTENTGEKISSITPARLDQLSGTEQFVLCVSKNGFAKRTSSFNYPTTNRGGKGVVAMATTERNGYLVSSFPVADSDHLILVSDVGRLIRCPATDISVIGRNSQGVTVFRAEPGESVVSADRVPQDNETELTEETTEIMDDENPSKPEAPLAENSRVAPTIENESLSDEDTPETEE